MSKTCPVCATVYADTDAFCPKDGTTLRMDETANTLVGSVIADRYLVSKLLGEGGMGQVYLAGHVRLPQQAAIKVLHSSMVQDAAAIARFNREAANAARIEHERVARVFDFGETSNGLVYLAMEFVPGRTLTEVLEEAGRLPPERAANIVYQVADGLEAAHRISIVHRDLKPDNILVVSDESGADKCKVVDFGIAKAFDGSESRKTQLTQAGAIIGTPEFMSPEQVLGENLDARSDVYALAVVAYHLLTGSLPFVATTPERSLTMRLIQDPSPLAETAPDVEWPVALQEAFDRALAREPEGRTPSALQFAEELIAATEGWTGGMVLRGRTPTSSASLTAARNAATVGMKAPVSGSRSAPTVDMPRKPATSAAAANGAEASASKSRVPMLVGALVVAAAVVGGGLFMMRGGDTPDVAGGGESATMSASAPIASDTDAALLAGNEATGNSSASANRDQPQSADVAQPAGERTTAADPRTTSSTTTPAQPSAAPGTRTDAAGTSGSGVAAAAPAGEQANAPAASTSANPAGAEALKREFDGIKARLLAAADSEAPQAAARQEIPRLQALLPRYSNATDSVWVYITLVQSYALVADEVGTCSALRTANRLATSRQQITAVTGLKSAFPNCL